MGATAPFRQSSPITSVQLRCMRRRTAQLIVVHSSSLAVFLAVRCRVLAPRPSQFEPASAFSAPRPCVYSYCVHSSALHCRPARRRCRGPSRVRRVLASEHRCVTFPDYHTDVHGRACQSRPAHRPCARRARPYGRLVHQPAAFTPPSRQLAHAFSRSTPPWMAMAPSPDGPPVARPGAAWDRFYCRHQARLRRSDAHLGRRTAAHYRCLPRRCGADGSVVCRRDGLARARWPALGQLRRLRAHAQQSRHGAGDHRAPACDHAARPRSASGDQRSSAAGDFADVTSHANRLRATLGLSPSPAILSTALSPYLYLQSSTPASRIPRPTPAQLHWIGPPLAAAPTGAALPAMVGGARQRPPGRRW